MFLKFPTSLPSISRVIKVHHWHVMSCHNASHCTLHTMLQSWTCLSFGVEPALAHSQEHFGPELTRGRALVALDHRQLAHVVPGVTMAQALDYSGVNNNLYHPMAVIPAISCPTLSLH